MTAAFTAQTVAGSITTLPAITPDASRSIIFRGEPVAPLVEARTADGVIVIGATESGGEQDELLELSASMVAFGAAAIPVSSEQMASLAEDEQPQEKAADPVWFSMALPTVIRNGETGSADAIAADDASQADDPIIP